MLFTLRESDLRRLGQINGFPVPTTGMVFFGLRGCVPVNSDDNSFKSAQQVSLADLNYLNPRCTLGQWLPGEEQIALFPGSTVPHLRYVKTARQHGGQGANQLMTGFYGDYRKGVHKPGSPTGHEAFRQVEGRPVRRTTDDFDFDNDDRVEFTNPFDNLHAAWCMGINHDSYASAGCQVVVGYPRCPQRNNKPDTGPWRVFREIAWGQSQNSFPYLLLNGRDALHAAANATQPMSARLRFGSKGSLVSQVQIALQSRGFYEGIIDDEFGSRTLRAVLAFQTSQFGSQADDGIVGPMTASALEIKWPSL